MPPEPSPRQSAEERFRSGDLAGCLKDLQSAIRKEPADAKLRIFLAQLLMVHGDWDRAVSQLKLVSEVEASALPMSHAYGTAIQCERVRADVFAGVRSPVLFGEPEPWIAQLMQSLTLLGKGSRQQAADLRAQAFDGAPATAGTLNGAEFEWIADADSRLGPVLEVLLNGAYFWVPMHRVSRITIEPPSDAPTWSGCRPGSSGPTAVGDGLIRRVTRTESTTTRTLARRTEWQLSSTTLYIGQGRGSFPGQPNRRAELRELRLRPENWWTSPRSNTHAAGIEPQDRLQPALWTGSRRRAPADNLSHPPDPVPAEARHHAAIDRPVLTTSGFGRLAGAVSVAPTQASIMTRPFRNCVAAICACAATPAPRIARGLLLDRSDDGREHAAGRSRSQSDVDEKTARGRASRPRLAAQRVRHR
jgi:type VI secretion system protein ImpE